MPTKQFQGTSFLVTYPQSSLSKDALSTFYRGLDAISYVKIGEESHQDGGKHFHVLAFFNTKQRFTSRALDVGSEHPNIETVGRKRQDWDRVATYVAKEDESPFEWGTPRHVGDIWSSVATASSREEALAIIAKERPRDYVLNARNIDYFLDKVYLALIYMNTPLFVQCLIL